MPKATGSHKAAKAPSDKQKKAHSSVGAPSQLKQTSRKGKKAWRKNVDLEDIEQGIEEIRAEEREFGTALHKQTSDQLFFVDVKGDDTVRKILPRFDPSQLTSAKIIAQRSAIPAVFSRTTSKKHGKHVSREDKERLSRIAKRPVKGPFNTIIDPTELGAGSAIIGVTEAVKDSGSYDVWAPVAKEEIPIGLETVQSKTIKPPTWSHIKSVIEIPAIIEPHQGTSYNPPVNAHQELLSKAHDIEVKRQEDTEKLAEVKDKMYNALQDMDSGTVVGMIVDGDGPMSEAEDGSAPIDIPIRKVPPRKTTQQKKKAAKQLAEKRVLAEKAAKKRMLNSINDAKSFRKQTENVFRQREMARAQRELTMKLKLKKGLAGQRLGRHKVAEGDVEVQLGEDLSESLRALKVEGNLFQDRFLSLQQRALLEPRTLLLGKRRKTRLVEYEKHAWKNFDR